MRFKNYYSLLNSQTGFKAYIKKRIFNNLLKELIGQEKEIERQNELIKNQEKALKELEARLLDKISMQNYQILQDLLETGNSASRNQILSNRYFQFTGDTINLSDDREKVNKVLIVEFNGFHGECIPGFYKYLSDLNFDVDVLVNEVIYKEKALDLVKCKNVFHCNYELMIHLLKYILMEKYTFVIFNSNAILKEKRTTVLQKLPFLQNHLKKIYVLEHQFGHQLEYLDKTLLEMRHVFFLTDRLPVDKRLIPVNCHWFGNTCLPPKNKVTRFISVGEINSVRRNFKMLLDAVEFLYNKGIIYFHITVIGRGNLEFINPKIRQFFSVLGRVSYSDMYSEIKKSDFFLPLLDPDNPDHDRYVTSGTSGSFQLIYGFSKPCLIERKFAEVYAFSSENAIVYEENKGLVLAMLKAIEMTGIEYESMRNNLITVSDDIYNKSLDNLKRVLVDSDHKNMQS